jgi:O-antigen ligase
MNLLAAFNKNSVWTLFALFNSQKIFQVLIFLLSALALGVVILVSSSFLVVLIPIGAFALYIFAKKPELGILAIIVTIASIIFERDLPLLPVPGGSLHIPDVILLFLLSRILIKAFTDENFKYLTTPLDYPIFLFILAAFMSVGISIFKYGLDSNSVIRSLRGIIYYLLIIVITNLIRERKQIRFLLGGLFVIGTVVSLMMLIQAKMGRSVRLLPGRIEADSNYWTTRIIPPGEVVIFVMLISAICAFVIMNRPFFKTTYFYLIPILGGGVLLTYNRQYWGSIIFSLFIFTRLLSKVWKRRFFSLIAIAFIFLILIIIPIITLSKTARVYSDSIVARFSSLFTVKQTFASGSLEWRKIENQYALRSIVKHPFLGIGLSNTYRPPLPGMDMETGWDTKRFVHNGYLFVLVDMGILGFLPLVWFYILFLSRGFSNWRKIRNPVDKSAVIGFTISGIALALSILVEPRFMQWHGIVVISTIIGINEAIIHLNENEFHEKRP